MLFQLDIARQPVDEVLRSYWAELGGEYTEDVREFATRLVAGTAAHLEDIDIRIRDRAENWRISRMAVVDRNILRLAVFEFLHEAKTPKTVTPGVSSALPSGWPGPGASRSTRAPW